MRPVAQRHSCIRGPPPGQERTQSSLLPASANRIPALYYPSRYHPALSLHDKRAICHATPYPLEFRSEAVALVPSARDRSVPQIAGELGVPGQTLRNWVR